MLLTTALASCFESRSVLEEVSSLCPCAYCVRIEGGIILLMSCSMRKCYSHTETTTYICNIQNKIAIYYKTNCAVKVKTMDCSPTKSKIIITIKNYENLFCETPAKRNSYRKEHSAIVFVKQKND